MVNQDRKFIKAAGHQLETLTIGKLAVEEPAMVFLHPGLGSLDLWNEFPQKVVDCTGSGALVYSRYGYGKSDPLEETRTTRYLHHEAQVVLPEVLDLFHIRSPVLFGHSDGATIALLFAAAFPNKPLAIIIEAPHIFVEEITIAGLNQARAAFDEGKLRRALEPHHIDAATTFKGWNDTWLNSEFRNWNIETELKSITCPILVIQGEDDQYGTMAQLQGIKKQAPQAELLMIPNCRHSPHQDQPDIVMKHTFDFMKRLGLVL